ncbi:hypothetical protein FG383_03550 [Psychrobacillus soli]|uniref:Uncharacterized protein n=1 Tax=Psychrobacillus soli TaxID=1543965 RepID=A0A544TKH2_9BACI|nr:hypothetical protein FG383_03550 [Psychrobacillus soli]
MKKRKETTPRKIIIICSIWSVLIIIQCIQIIYSPHTFVRAINLISTILLSTIIGAFIRELFILKKTRD